MTRVPCEIEGRSHLWFSALVGASVTEKDWCVRCGEPTDPRPHLVLKGQRREVENIDPPEGLL